jgi:arylsulfatase A-like enzyme
VIESKSAVLKLALWFGLLAGLIEAAGLAIKRFALGQLIKASGDFLWLAPAASVALFLVVAAPLFVISLWPAQRRRIWLAACGVLAFLAAFNVILLSSALANYAKATIAAGVAVQFTRYIRRRADVFQRLVDRTLPLMGAMAVVLAAGVAGSRWWTYRQEVAALPPAPAQSPNVVFIVLDTVRARSLSLYGYSRPTTPNLERWAKNAVVFDEAIAPTSWTFPSHASMFTGRWPHELSADWQTPLDNRFPTIAEVLRDRGYLTAGFAANVFYCTSEFGIARGFAHYEDYPVSFSQFLVSSAIGRELFSFSLNVDLAFHVREWIGYEEIPGRRNAAHINDAFLTWLDRQDPSRPFFAFLNYLDAHQPFLPPAPFDTRFRGDRPRGNPAHSWDRRWSSEEIQAETDAYDGAIAYLDHELGRLGDELERRGKWNDTLVIVTSDHGEHLGEHGFMRHGQTLYRDVLRVPLMFLLPGRTANGERVQEVVSLRDIPPTVMSVLNLSCNGCFPGEPLTRHWTDAGADGNERPPVGFSELKRGIRVPDRYPNAKGDLHSLFDSGLHYIVNSNGQQELYDLLLDPREEQNLAGAASASEPLERMRRGLASIVGTGSGAGTAAQPVK